MSVTWRPDRRPPGTRRRPPLPRPVALVALAVLATVALATAACGGDGGQVHELVVPRGTQERLDRGETVVVMPTVLRFEVGDTLRIRNEDVVDQSVGPYLVRAGEQFEMTYGSPGRYEGWCPLSLGERYEIVISE